MADFREPEYTRINHAADTIRHLREHQQSNILEKRIKKKEQRMKQRIKKKQDREITQE